MRKSRAAGIYGKYDFDTGVETWWKQSLRQRGTQPRTLEYNFRHIRVRRLREADALPRVWSQRLQQED